MNKTPFFKKFKEVAEEIFEYKQIASEVENAKNGRFYNEDEVRHIIDLDN